MALFLCLSRVCPTCRAVFIMRWFSSCLASLFIVIGVSPCSLMRSCCTGWRMRPRRTRLPASSCCGCTTCAWSSMVGAGAHQLCVCPATGDSAVRGLLRKRMQAAAAAAGCAASAADPPYNTERLCWSLLQDLPLRRLALWWQQKLRRQGRRRPGWLPCSAWRHLQRAVHRRSGRTC